MSCYEVSGPTMRSFEQQIAALKEIKISAPRRLCNLWRSEAYKKKDGSLSG
jgi:hypothetical protein